MKTTPYQRGAAKERRLMEYLERLGYDSYRVCGSKGVDIIASKLIWVGDGYRRITLFIECKSESSFFRLSKEDLEFYKSLFEKYRGDYEIWVRKDRFWCRFYNLGYKTGCYSEPSFDCKGCRLPKRFYEVLEIS
jgi:Holliday junction resolvase